MSEHYIFSYFNPFLDTLTSQTASEKYFSKIYEKQIKEQLVIKIFFSTNVALNFSVNKFQ